MNPEKLKTFGIGVNLCSDGKNMLRKIIFVRKGEQLKLHYHRSKDETVYLYSGLAQLEIHDAKGQSQILGLCPGKSYRIEPIANIAS